MILSTRTKNWGVIVGIENIIRKAIERAEMEGYIGIALTMCLIEKEALNKDSALSVTREDFMNIMAKYGGDVHVHLHVDEDNENFQIWLDVDGHEHLQFVDTSVN